MKRADGLFEKIISNENLDLAIKKVNASHHWRPRHIPNKCTAWVERTKDERREELRQIILKGFEQQKPKVKQRYDTSARKWRTISEPRLWPDQYVHHALIQVIKPVILKGMDHFCCGSVEGRGTHYGAKAIRKWMRGDRKGTKYCLSMDIRHFYDSLTKEAVMGRMRKIIKDGRALDLIERTLAFGVLIGAYTSQWYANAVLQEIDHMIREGGFGAAHYIRYIDNFTVFGPNKRKLRKLRIAVLNALAGFGLTLKGDWQVFPSDKRLPNALGYRYGRDYTLPRKNNFLRLKRKIALWRRRTRRGVVTQAREAAGLLSRLGQLRHCNNHRHYVRLFRGEKVMRILKQTVRAAQAKRMTWPEYLLLHAA